MSPAWPRALIILLLLILMAIDQFADGNPFEECPRGCACDVGTKTLECEGLDLTGIPPPNWPADIQCLTLRNATLQTVERNAFRRFQNLREIRLIDCPNLDLIDRHAFKLLKQLRSIEIRGNRNLRELYKASFSAIGNEHALSIQIRHNAIERVRAHTFKNVHNVRELVIEDRCFDVEGQAFSSMTKVDFVTLKGACSIESFAFRNTSRIYNLNIVDSSMDLKTNTFAELNHVNQIQLRDNRIGRIEAGAFAGIFTVGSAHLQSNQIAKVMHGAFAGTENLGSLVISYNAIRDSLDDPECLEHGAQRFVFTENTMHCDCRMLWLIRRASAEQQDGSGQQPSSSLLTENYCGREQQNKALISFDPAGCPTPPAPSTSPSSITSTASRGSWPEGHGNKDSSEQSRELYHDDRRRQPSIAGRTSPSSSLICPTIIFVFPILYKFLFVI